MKKNFFEKLTDFIEESNFLGLGNNNKSSTTVSDENSNLNQEDLSFIDDARIAAWTKNVNRPGN